MVFGNRAAFRCLPTAAKPISAKSRCASLQAAWGRRICPCDTRAASVAAGCRVSVTCILVSGSRRRRGILRRQEPSRNQRIYHGQGRESPEIAIGGPELLYAVLQAQGCDACVMHSLAPRPCRQAAGCAAVPSGLAIRRVERGRRFDPGVDLCQPPRERRWRREYLRMGHYSQEFMDAWPGNRPRRAALGKHGQPLIGGLVPFESSRCA